MTNQRILFALLAASVASAALGWGWQRSAHPLNKRLSPSSAQAIVQLQGLDVPSPSVQGSAALPLQLVPGTKIFTVPVMLGGVQKQFLLDTGASTSLVAPETVQQLQLRGIPIPQERLGLAVAGDDCPDLRATLHTLPTLSMQGVQVQGLSALNFNSTVIPKQLAGVLGMDMLRFFDMQLHPQQRALYLSPASPLPTEWQPHAVPLTKKLGVMLVRIEVNGQGPFTFLLDTGAGSTFISQEVARRAQVAAVQPNQVLGFCGLEEAAQAKLNSVKMHRFQQDDLDAIILSSSSILSVLEVDGILGQNFLNQYQQYWRFTKGQSAQGPFDGSLILVPLPSRE
ncbi:MAG: retropepsin-like aspartic protease [Thermosynechococcaceae cyanobacterium]